LKWLDAGGSAEPVGKPPTKEAADLRKSLKPFVLSTLRYRVVSFSENSNVPTSEGKVMETYFKTFPQLSEFFKQSGQNALKFNYVREPYFGRVRFFINLKRHGSISQ
jgi:hypothetical protein